MEVKSWDSFLVAEHEMIERAMDVLKRELERLSTLSHDILAIRRAIDFLAEFGDRTHNKKEEEFLFPLLIERGIPQDGPIRVMLLEHESERALLRDMSAEASGLGDATQEARESYIRKGLEYLEIRANHIWKENDVLYAMGRKVFTEDDNTALLEGFEGINAASYGEKAPQHFSEMLEEVEGGAKARRSLIHNLSIEQIDAIMETIPIELTFVDADDTVAYFNRLDREKIFVRTRSVVGKKVQKCHPEESVDRVQEVVDRLRSGAMDKADFWIDFAGDKIRILYFPVRDEGGQYLGVLEVTQRIGEIQKLSGEKRLLDLD